MKKIVSIIILLLATTFFAIAQNEIEISQEKVMINGEKFYLHTVKQGQTLYSICKTYRVSEKDVLNNNKELQSGNLSIGQIVRIPVKQELSKDGKYIVHTVIKGETIYALLKRYEITEAEFYRINPNLNKAQSLQIGQELFFPIKEESTPAQANNNVKENNTVQPTPATPAQPEIVEIDTANYIYHKVAKGETIYRITKIFNISQSELIEANPQLSNRSLSLDEIIRIPRKKNEAGYTASEPVQVSTAETTVLQEEPDDMFVGQAKSEITIALLLPFDVDLNTRNLTTQEGNRKPQKMQAVTERALDFYYGVLTAITEFKNDGVKINLNVYDIGKGTFTLENLVSQNAFNNVDMIIGPAYKSQVEFLKSKDITTPMLLPFLNDQATLEKYSGLISLTPCNESIREAISEFAAQHKDANFIVVRSNKDNEKSIADEFFNAIERTGAKVQIANYNGTVVSSPTSHMGENENFFILTMSDEMSTNRIFTQLFQLRKNHEITIIGDPKILTYDNLDAFYYSEVKFTYYTTEDKDYSKTETKDFVEMYRAAFLCEPSLDAFTAANAIRYFVPMLKKYGDKFIKKIDCTKVLEGMNGNVQYSKIGNSYTEKIVYLHTMQHDYSFVRTYPAVEQNQNVEE